MFVLCHLCKYFVFKISFQEFCTTYTHPSTACRVWQTFQLKSKQNIVTSSYLHDMPVNILSTQTASCVRPSARQCFILHNVSLIRTVSGLLHKDCCEEYSHTSNRFYFLVLACIVLNPWKQEPSHRHPSQVP